MRLTTSEQASIRAAAHQAFGEAVVVRLFGSRLDEGRRGGDIDLLVQVREQPSPLAKTTFRRLLDRTVGEREYDILIAIDGEAVSPVQRKALAEGLIL